ncbi:hypothetical protein [Tenacibaculum agarivorans]|uniref:hypothetical protein n=1 Tax=Tenacibaculum agarivorans TaxID=1908389 RepID=UPI000A9F418B|nr:hypothetical protein [Tenacibaculum agarivorans]
MKIFFKPLLLSTIMISAFTFTSCNSEDANDIFRDDDMNPDDNNYQIIVNPTNAGSSDRTVDITANAASTVDVKVSYSTDDDNKKMRRIYITKNVFSSNEGPQPFSFPDGIGEKKADGSIDLDGDDKSSFDFTFTFNTPDNPNDVVQYVIWTTNNRGDYRDISDSNSIADNAYGTVTITAGNGTTSTGFKEFSQTILAAPLADGTSKTFVSVFNNETYKISEGIETSALWDFGYFFGLNTKASFYSTYDFPQSGFGGKSVEEVSGVSQAELNRCYFGLSSKTSADFDAINSGSSLENSLTTASDERIQGLKEGDIVEFLDQYGNKGLIRVTDIVEGNGTNGKITFDVKVQITAIPLKS